MKDENNSNPESQDPSPTSQFNSSEQSSSAELPHGLASSLLDSPVFSGLDGNQGDILVPELLPMYTGDLPFLARFLPHSTASHLGFSSSFCDLHAFLRYLHQKAWHGFICTKLESQSAYALVFEGRTVAAATASTTGESALGEMLSMYDQGAEASAYPLDGTLAHVLSGIGNRAWNFNLTEDFTGLHARPAGAILYVKGEIIATMPATLTYEGAFPAPLRPQALILPPSLASWAHQSYTLTLRGRDALNAITDIHIVFKAKYGISGLHLLKAISQKITPAEHSTREELALHEIEPMLHSFIQSGFLQGRS